MKLYFDEKTVKKQGYSYEVKEMKGNLTISLKKFGIPVGSVEIEKDMAKTLAKSINEVISTID